MTLAALLGANIVRADNLSQAYCSSENTGSSFTPGASLSVSYVNILTKSDPSIWQSNGYCTNACKNVNGKSYALAIVQGSNCWCNDYVPAEQVSTSQCNTPCIGFPYENCGNENAGLFGYIQIGTPSGTAGASSASSTQASDSSTVSCTLASPHHTCKACICLGHRLHNSLHRHSPASRFHLALPSASSRSRHFLYCSCPLPVMTRVRAVSFKCGLLNGII